MHIFYNIYVYRYVLRISCEFCKIWVLISLYLNYVLESNYMPIIFLPYNLYIMHVYFYVWTHLDLYINIFRTNVYQTKH